MAQVRSIVFQLGLATALAASLAIADAEAAAMLRVTQNKAEAISLDGAVGVVMVANPDIADVVVEQNHVLFILGKRAGETRLFVFDNGGQRLMERDIVVVPEPERTVTVTRDGAPTEYSCAPRCVSLGDAKSGSGGGRGGAPTPSAPAPAATADATPAAPQAPAPPVAGPGATTH